MMTKRQKENAEFGFTLLELMVSMAVGLIVLAAVASLFKTGMDSTLVVTQRAEIQQNMRAAIDLMTKDITMAGAGLPTGGISLPSGAGSSAAKFGCDQTGTCHVTNHTYTGNLMYGIIPGYLNGVEGGATIAAAPSPAVNDSITLIYADYIFPLNEYDVTFTSTTSGANVTLAVDPSYTANPPPGITCPGGINVGDLIMVAGGGKTAVGEVTAVSSSANSTTCGNGTAFTGAITFANGDPLNMNQDGAASGNLKAIASALGGQPNGVAYRLYAVTYYINVPTATGQTPRLMRQVNGLAPSPVADDIINLQYAFDVYNSTTDALDSNEANPLGAGESPNNIQKVNLILMGESIINDGNKSKSLYLATDVSARNMAFRNRYK
jgi:type IV pilus assembly protein PilW